MKYYEVNDDLSEVRSNEFAKRRDDRNPTE